MKLFGIITLTLLDFASSARQPRSRWTAPTTGVLPPARGSLSQDVGPAVQPQAGEARIGEVVGAGGLERFRRAAETPLNRVYENASPTARHTCPTASSRRRPPPGRRTSRISSSVAPWRVAVKVRVELLEVRPTALDVFGPDETGHDIRTWLTHWIRLAPRCRRPGRTPPGSRWTRICPRDRRQPAHRPQPTPTVRRPG